MYFAYNYIWFLLMCKGISVIWVITIFGLHCCLVFWLYLWWLLHCKIFFFRSSIYHPFFLCVWFLYFASNWKRLFFLWDYKINSPMLSSWLYFLYLNILPIWSLFLHKVWGKDLTLFFSRWSIYPNEIYWIIHFPHANLKYPILPDTKITRNSNFSISLLLISV